MRRSGSNKNKLEAGACWKNLNAIDFWEVGLIILLTGLWMKKLKFIDSLELDR
jgi:hypothetical protein